MRGVGRKQIDGVNDMEEYGRLQKALDVLNFSADEQDAVCI